MLLEQPILKPCPKSKLYMLVKDYILTLENCKIVVPNQFMFDGASIPWIAWQIVGVPFDPRFMLPSLIHDWLYITHVLSREEADDLFYYLLVENKVDKNKAFLMWIVVRRVGWIFWKNTVDNINKLNYLYEITKCRYEFKHYLYQFDFYKKTPMEKDMESVKYM